MRTHPSISYILLTFAMAGLAACGSALPKGIPTAPAANEAGSTPAASAPAASPGTASSATPGSASPGTAGSANGCTGSTAAQEKAAAADWTAFFDAKTPVSQRVALLQDGSEFAAIIQAQAKSPLAASASAAVTKVSLTSCSLAEVSYSILVDGSTALPDQLGQAVNTTGTWQVGDSSFCGLLILENSGSTSDLPPACSAG